MGESPSPALIAGIKHVLKGRQLHNEGYLGRVPAEQEEYPKASDHERIAENNDFIMDLQTDRLLEMILAKNNMNNAYFKVKSNKGVGVVDKMRVDELLPYLKENKDKLVGGQRKYGGVVGSSVLKVFDLTAASTGMNERALQRQGLVYGKDYRFTVTFPADHATYYPGAKKFALKMIFSMKDGKVLGAQAIGPKGVDKRIDVIASVIRFGGTVQDLMDLELCYAPPFSSAKDPVNMAGYYADNIMQGMTNPLLPNELEAELNKGALLIDVRSPEMFAAGHINGAVNIPASKLRTQLDTLDKNRPIIVSCRVGINGYYMERMLTQHGFTVRNLMGGFSYARWFALDLQN